MMYTKGMKNAEIEENIKALKVEQVILNAKIDGARAAEWELSKQFVENVFETKGIVPGDKCRANFSDGAEFVIFCNITDYGHISVLHYTKKGTICKIETYYDYSYAEIFHKDLSDNG